jgi:MoxR-like ATPase
MAYLQGRDYVVPKDILMLYTDTLAHRLILRPDMELGNVSAARILDSILKSVNTPRI